MPPKPQHEDQPADQGQFFPVDASRTHPPVIGEVVHGGVYPEDLAPPEDPELQPLHQAVHETVVAEQHTRNRRTAQAGKHSPLARDGHYNTIQLGDFLPGFGPVTERGWDNAMRHARKLEDQRMREQSGQATLPITESVTEPSSDPKSLEEVIAEVAAERAVAIAAHESRRQQTRVRLEKEMEAAGRKGGAFGGALKRRILATDSAAMRARTNDHDVSLLTATNLHKQLFPTHKGDLTYAGLLFTPEEYGAITISPEQVGKRLGAKILRHTTDRPATERHARRREVVEADLRARITAASETLAGLTEEAERIDRLRKEMRSPGYAHMTLDEMDGLMKTTEDVFNKMFRAIVESKGLGTERQESLTAAMEFLVAEDNYKKAFDYWQQMSSLALSWTHAKIKRFEPIKTRLEEQATITA